MSGADGLSSGDFTRIAVTLREDLPDLLAEVPLSVQLVPRMAEAPLSTAEAIDLRTQAIHAQMQVTLRRYADEVEQAAALLLRWMLESSVVRIIGAGRARLAASIPANRLAHGGARVFVQDDIVPMPHTIRGGGMIAASASGSTATVLDVLRTTRQYTADITILGVASSAATEFRELCDVFIGIEPPPPGRQNPLKALADSEEYIISELLDGIVVSAGQMGGFDEGFWRLGHEDLSGTGPYNFGQDRH